MNKNNCHFIRRERGDCSVTCICLEQHPGGKGRWGSGGVIGANTGIHKDAHWCSEQQVHMCEAKHKWLLHTRNMGAVCATWGRRGCSCRKVMLDRSQRSRCKEDAGSQCTSEVRFELPHVRGESATHQLHMLAAAHSVVCDGPLLKVKST